MRRCFHRYKDQSAVVEKTSENFSNFKVMNNEAMKQIKIAAKGKLLEEKLQTSEGKFRDQKYLILGRATYLTFQSSRATLVLMSLFNRSFTSC